MDLLGAPRLFWLLALMLGGGAATECISRKTVPYHKDHGHLFSEAGAWNYSTMLLREDLGLLVLGARDAIYALDLDNISSRKASVKWEVPQSKQTECTRKGKDAQMHCKNYIRILHTMSDGRMFVCGTYAFDPACDFMSYKDGKLVLEKTEDDGKGKCPFDPDQTYASIMVGDDLYSATSMNFLGSEPVFMRSSSVSVRTEFNSAWLNGPSFISMAQVPESLQSSKGDDDKIYLFFNEAALEYDSYTRLVVPRVARVCKGDRGGLRTLQKKWTSFMKAQMDCPVPESPLPLTVQDTFLSCGPGEPWGSCLFYAVFSQRRPSSELAAVCAYRVSDVSDLFSRGKYKDPLPVETSYVKWVMYSGDVPSPRPGACIDDEARKLGVTETLDLPDQTLQFIKDRPLMDQAALPVGGGPLLVQRDTAFSRIIVDRVDALDGNNYHVMFVGTERGGVVKAVNYDGKMFVIEEVQLFPSQEPVQVLKLSELKGHLYAGSVSGAVQVPLATCGRSLSCMDCVLSRDPYCGWDPAASACVAHLNTSRKLIQSVKTGNASLCPPPGPVRQVNESVWPRGQLRLPCPPPSNLAEVSWQRDARPLVPSANLQVLPDGLLISNAEASHAGRYRCTALERSPAGGHSSLVADYRVIIAGWESVSPAAQHRGPSVAGLQAAVGLLVILLAALLCWNFYRGHLPLPCRGGGESGEGEGRREAGGKPSARESSTNGENVVLQADGPKHFIADESEI